MRRIAILLVSILCTLPVSVAQASTATFDAPTRIAPTKLKKVGHLRIPSLKVNSVIYDGVTDAQFNVGVGQWKGAPNPGASGNIVIGGHRTSAHRPFANIHRLKAGSEIFIQKNGATHRYVVTKKFVVNRTALWITDPTADPVLTLFSCHPVGKTSHRIVIRAVYSPL